MALRERHEEAETALSRYILNLDESSSECPRVRCDGCNSSRSIFCPYCLEILLPRESWPPAIRDRSLRLPFKLDIILDDRRTSSTGMQAATILRACSSAQNPPDFRLFDIEMNDSVPSYDTKEEREGTFLLFPGPSSVPLSSILTPINRLVVLDCKWSRSTIRLHPNLNRLPTIHLENPPKKSFYWRWHNSGEGMLSTLEAVYYSSWQVAGTQEWETSQKEQLVSLFWLFALQRGIIRRNYESGDGRELAAPVPFSEDGKEYHRSLRRKQKINPVKS